MGRAIRTRGRASGSRGSVAHACIKHDDPCKTGQRSFNTTSRLAELCDDHGHGEE